MPLYSTSAFAPLPEVAIPAKPAYFFGSLNTSSDDTYLRISNVALASNVATVTGTIYRGNIPVVGSLISIQGTTTASGAFNVSGAAITAVSGTPSTGVYSISFALTHADVGSTADAGMAVIPIAETAETCANGTSVAIYVPSNELRDLGEKSITVATTFPSKGGEGRGLATGKSAPPATLQTENSNRSNHTSICENKYAKFPAPLPVTCPVRSNYAQ